MKHSYDTVQLPIRNCLSSFESFGTWPRAVETTISLVQRKGAWSRACAFQYLRWLMPDLEIWVFLESSRSGFVSLSVSVSPALCIGPSSSQQSTDKKYTNAPESLLQLSCSQWWLRGDQGESSMLRHVHQLIVWVFDGFCTNQTTEKSHGVACLAFGRDSGSFVWKSIVKLPEKSWQLPAVAAALEAYDVVVWESMSNIETAMESGVDTKIPEAQVEQILYYLYDVLCFSERRHSFLLKFAGFRRPLPQCAWQGGTFSHCFLTGPTSTPFDSLWKAWAMLPCGVPWGRSGSILAWSWSSWRVWLCLLAFLFALFFKLQPSSL